MLIRYNDEASFARKINMIKALSAKNSKALEKDITLRFRVGVCHAFGGTKGTAMEMVDNAVASCKLAEEKTNVPYVVYDVKINEEIAKNEKIEGMMEDGLKNGDFKLFLQPKYNIKGDRIDSAEALVRWFDRERADYIFPGEFIGLFETNGFIVKLDHYVYLEVLKYFKNAVERGEKIVPISVNVSRVTATAPDFLEFYIENKKKYGIGDGFIMLELTESFAFDDNKTIVNIVNKLHENGIKCSLDDFGAGFSSFRTLKNIAFDELKLDRCFIEKDSNEEKGDVVLKTVIGLFKSLGMTVVQEGVETEEMLNKITEYGCDVAQGFYYAKAIPVEEYKLFLNSNTSIMYKSKVK
jgi:EAL domain-containing protein (putative c-di-GMP-specific phosphodiesterase class I)